MTTDRPVSLVRSQILAAKAELESGATSMADIARRIGCSRERVRQLTVALGIVPRRKPLLCKRCGKERQRPKNPFCLACTQRQLVTFEAHCTWCGRYYVKVGLAASWAKRYLKKGHAPTCPECHEKRVFCKQYRGGMTKEELAERRRASYHARYHTDAAFRERERERARVREWARRNYAKRKAAP